MRLPTRTDEPISSARADRCTRRVSRNVRVALTNRHHAAAKDHLHFIFAGTEVARKVACDEKIQVAAALHTSLTGFTKRKSISCSRAMNAKVPATATPVAVKPENPACSKFFARPKSETLAIWECRCEQHVLGLEIAMHEALACA